MSGARISGVTLILFGLWLLGWGLSESQSMVNELSHSVSGSLTDGTMNKLIVGAIAICAGALLFRRRR